MSENFIISIANDFKKSYVDLNDSVTTDARPWCKYTFIPIIVTIVWLLGIIMLLCSAIILWTFYAIFDPVNLILKPIGKFIYWIFYKEPERKNEN
jgi:DMSO reductase anchor subunit